MLSDIFWYLICNGPRDFAFAALLIGLGLLGCFLRFFNKLTQTKKPNVKAKAQYVTSNSINPKQDHLGRPIN
jgi:hypothetical protein